MGAPEGADGVSPAGLDLLEIVRRHFEESGSKAFVVGGWVRDTLLSRQSVDLDVVVDGDAWGHARAIARASQGSFVGLDRDRDFARVVWAAQAGPSPILDIAPFQGPDLLSDLRARDFTLNAMAAPLGADIASDADAIVDPTGGRDDLAAKLIRMTSPGVFDADPLRLLRAPRLAAELGFTIDEATRRRVVEQATKIRLPAGERVREEMLRLLQAESVASSVAELEALGLLDQLIAPGHVPLEGARSQAPSTTPESTTDVLSALESIERLVSGSVPGTVVGQQVVEVLAPYHAELADHVQRPELGNHRRGAWLRLAALVAERNDPDPADVALRMRLSKAENAYLTTVVENRDRPAKLALGGRINRRSVYKYYRSCGSKGVDVALLALASCFRQDEARSDQALCSTCSELLRAWYRRYDQVVSPKPFLDGLELMSELNLPPGPEVGRLLELIAEAQAAGVVADREQALNLAREAIAGD